MNPSPISSMISLVEAAKHMTDILPENVAQVTEWVNDVDLNQPILSEDGQTLLMIAVKSGNERFVHLLISLGGKKLDYALQDSCNRNVIHFAVQGGKITLVNYLLREIKVRQPSRLSEIVNYVDDELNTPLSLATADKAHKICFVLLKDGGANPDAGYPSPNESVSQLKDSQMSDIFRRFQGLSLNNATASFNINLDQSSDLGSASASSTASAASPNSSTSSRPNPAPSGRANRFERDDPPVSAAAASPIASLGLDGAPRFDDGPASPRTLASRLRSLSPIRLLQRLVADNDQEPVVHGKGWVDPSKINVKEGYEFYQGLIQDPKKLAQFDDMLGTYTRSRSGIKQVKNSSSCEVFSLKKLEGLKLIDEYSLNLLIRYIYNRLDVSSIISYKDESIPLLSVIFMILKNNQGTISHTQRAWILLIINKAHAREIADYRRYVGFSKELWDRYQAMLIATDTIDLEGQALPPQNPRELAVGKIFQDAKSIHDLQSIKDIVEKNLKPDDFLLKVKSFVKCNYRPVLCYLNNFYSDPKEKTLDDLLGIMNAIPSFQSHDFAEWTLCRNCLDTSLFANINFRFTEGCNLYDKVNARLLEDGNITKLTDASLLCAKERTKLLRIFVTCLQALSTSLDRTDANRTFIKDELKPEQANFDLISNHFERLRTKTS